MRLLVLGLGPAGSAAAITGRQLGAEVIMVGRVSPLVQSREQRPGETLPPHASPILRELGIYDQVLRCHAVSPGIVSAWDSEIVHEFDFVFDAYGHGWHLDRNLFDEQLLNASANLGAHIHGQSKLRAASYRHSAWEIEFEEAGCCRKIRADRVIDATGRSAWLGKQIGNSRQFIDQMVGIVVHMDGVLTGDARTYIEAAEDGWWYFADLPGDQCVAAYMTDNTVVAVMPGGARGLWRARIASSPCAQAFQVTGIKSFQVVSANSSRMDQFAGSNWAAVGDAAFSWDPLSSQGITNALDSGRRAALALLSGQQAIDDYCKWMEDGWDQYLLTRSYFYSCVNRWPQSTFWRKRLASPVDLESSFA